MMTSFARGAYGPRLDEAVTGGNEMTATTDERRDTYWTRSYRRRTFLGSGAALGIGAASIALVGCGGSNSTKGSGLSGLATPTQGANASPTVDPFAGAKRGGTLKLTLTGDPPTIDPYGNVSFLTKGHAAAVYSRLFKYKAGPGIKGTEVRPTGDLAATAENSPDGLKWTIKLKPGVKFQNIAPVNGRAVTTDDVKFSYARATDPKTTNGTQLSFIDKVEYPDASTVVFTLKAVNVTFLDVIADSNLLWIMPTESDTKFNPTTAAVGSGPWIFESYNASVSLFYRKNPDWYENGYPLADRLEYAIIPDYPNRLAQFLAKNTDAEGLSNDDLVSAKTQVPDVQLSGDVANSLSMIYFDTDPSSPWAKDDRVRQAISMSFDRDALTDLAYNIKKLQAAGISVSAPWNNMPIPAGMTRFWLDPQGKDQGDTAQFFKYDPTGAKQLLSAAGLSNLSFTYQYAGNRYGKQFGDVAEAQIAYINAIGIKTTTDVQDYASKYIPQTAVGNFKGIAFGPQTGFAEGGGYVLRMFSDNPGNQGRINMAPGPMDQEIIKLVSDQQKETDDAKRKDMIWNIQRAQDKHMYYIPCQYGAGTAFTGYQGYVKNALTFRTTSYGGSAETLPYWWKSV